MAKAPNWRQVNALRLMAAVGDVTPWAGQPWLQNSLRSLARAGLAAKVSDIPPAWRITEEGREALEEEEARSKAQG